MCEIILIKECLYNDSVTGRWWCARSVRTATSRCTSARVAVETPARSRGPSWTARWPSTPPSGSERGHDTRSTFQYIYWQIKWLRLWCRSSFVYCYAILQVVKKYLVCKNITQLCQMILEVWKKSMLTFTHPVISYCKVILYLKFCGRL